MGKRGFIVLLLTVFFSSFFYGIEDFYGKIEKEEILTSFPEWQKTVTSYLPDPEIIYSLQTFDIPVNIEIFLGTWCRDSAQHVSEYFKIMNLVDNPYFMTLYTGIPKDKESREQYIKGKYIQKIPTFIFFIDGEEIGRVIEHPITSLEEDILDIISVYSINQVDIDLDYFLSNYHADLNIDCTQCHQPM